MTFPYDLPFVFAGGTIEGDTLSALQAGSGSYRYTVAIEGCPYLLTDAHPDAAIEAWASRASTHHYADAVDGLFVVLENQQQLDWRNPFPRGGQLTLHVVGDSFGEDRFGIDVHKRNAGARTELEATLARTTTAVPLTKSSVFGSSGEVYIGNECIEFDGNASDELTATIRGKYAPFACDPDGTASGVGFAGYHRVGEGPLEVQLNPLVTAQPRKWIGKWVGVYLHKFEASTGAMNDINDALCVFAGRIVSNVDDPATAATVIEVKHALDCVVEATVGGRDQYEGKIKNLIYLAAGMTFSMTDKVIDPGSGLGISETADDLVVTVGASGANEAEPGWYTHVEIFGFLNTWLASEKAASNLLGTYSFGLHLPTDGSIQTYIWWTVPGSTSAVDIKFTLTMPLLIAGPLGYFTGQATSTVNGFLMGKVQDGPHDGGQFYAKVSEENLKRAVISSAIGNPVVCTTESGAFVDQYSSLPGSVKPPTTLGDGYGVFLIDEHILAFGYVSDNPSGLVIYDLKQMPDQLGLGVQNGDDLTNWRLPWTQGGPEDVPIRQVPVIELALSDALAQLFLSTGSVGYNDVDHDKLPYGVGIAMPHEICADAFLQSIAALPHHDKVISLVLDKQTKLSELLAGELIIRRAFLRWKNGGLEFATWKSPLEANSVATLDEDNKAAPAGNTDHHKSVTSEDGSWAAPIVKIQYSRTLAASPTGDDGYRDTITIVDKAAVDDHGGDAQALTINCRGTFGDFDATGATIDSLSVGFMASMPLFTQPARQTSRSIDQRYYEGLSIGDVVAVTDKFARDPDTGRRGVVTRYGIVTRHRYSFGGLVPNASDPDPQGGDVDLFFLDSNNTAAYVPCAEVDESKNDDGYTAGFDGSHFWVKEHAHSEATEDADVTRFAPNDKIRIIEIDPPDPAAPLYWDMTVDDITGNSIGLGETIGDFDDTKRYRIVYRPYSVCQTSQQVKTFQADDGDGQIEDLRGPFEYGIGGADGTFSFWDADDDVELPPDMSAGDGIGRDVGHEVAIARLLNNLVMYKTGVSSPGLLASAYDPTPVVFGSATWICVQARPVKLGSDTYSGDCYRGVTVAPHFRSLAGATANCRVTLSRTPPAGASYLDVDRGNIIASNTFTTTSTTFATPTPVELRASVKDFTGVVWVYVEINSAASTWGLSHLQETALRQEHTFISV